MDPPSPENLAQAVRDRLAQLADPSPEAVINATGVVIHTNLGRSPFSPAAVARIAEVAAHYSNLEFNVDEGRRGSRHDHVRDLLRLLTGAEDALVVNNNAAAVLLTLRAMAEGRDVVISRGELVEIGGSFRIPDILAQSGARLHEVGTTNRTHPADYAAAVGPETGLLLKVHTSNYRISGFTAEVELPELVRLGRERGVPVAVDLGSGSLVDVSGLGLHPEPHLAEVVAQGPDLITLSGDKLLGGPQAGIVLGSKDAVGRLRRHPLARVVRIDKLLLAALQATLVAYLDEDRARREIPVLQSLFQDPGKLRERAEAVASAIRETLGATAPQVMVESATSAVGGGTLPGEGLPTTVIAVDPQPHVSAARLERALRHVRPAVIGRIHEERVLLDLRTVTVAEEGRLPGLMQQAWNSVSQVDGEGA